MKEEKNEVLRKLLVDEEELNKDLLFNILSRYIRIGKKTGKIIPTVEFQNLSERNKILVCLLGIKASKEIGLVESEIVSAKEISEQSGVNYNSVRSYLSALFAAGLVAKSGNKYYVPNYALIRVKELLTGEKNEKKK